MPASQSIRKRRRKRGEGTVKLNITSMIDMFTLMVVFLLMNYSAQGQLVTPAQGLRLPTSSVDTLFAEALTVKVSQTNILIDTIQVLPPAGYQQLLVQKDFLIEPLYAVLSKRAEEARKSAEMFHAEFSGKITIQGDTAIPYNVLTRVMYTCGQAGYPVMNLAVYKKG
jgi:biopolymer transport protein ExbD